MITTFKIFEYIRITEIPSFKKWFRDSKIVDDYGKPLLLFHGFDFTKFKHSSSILSLGFYFTTEPDLSNAKLIPVYLSLQNPKNMPASEWLKMMNYSLSKILKIRKDLINQGYDGIIIENDLGELKIPQYVAFSSNLAKSAINNNGDFDLNNFIIDESKSEEKPGKEGLLNSHSIPNEMKDKIMPYINNNSYYINKKVLDLSIPKIEGKSFNGVSLGADKNGFFVYTHRCRSHSYETPEKIPNNKIKFVESTG